MVEFLCITGCLIFGASHLLTLKAFYKLQERVFYMESFFDYVLEKLGPCEVAEFLDLAESHGFVYVLKYKLGLAQEGVDFVTHGSDEE